MKKLILFSLLVIVVLSGCSRGDILTKNYYILEYYEHTEKPQLKQDIPLDLSVFIMDTKVSKTYNRNQLVVRHFGPRITYSYYDLWGVKLSKIIPDLIQQRLQAYNVFRQTNREVLGLSPEMEIITSLNNIELYKAETVQQARVNMDFILREVGKERSIVHHNINVERRLLSNDTDTFVQTANEIILDETDSFINKIIANCTDEGCLDFTISENEEQRKLQQLLVEEEEEAPEGNGLLFLPALSRTENEPKFTAIDQYGARYEGQMGVPLPLLAGNYSIHYGSGRIDQTMTRTDVEIVPRFRTIIEPDWGCLIVDVIDEQRNYAKVHYEIFDMKGDSYGGGFPAEEEIGEQAVVYVLEPGTYKITINNEPFNTYRDFTTTYMEAGEGKRLTIVVETDEDDNPLSMVGAGVLEESFLEDSDEKIKFSSAIHGNVNINSDNEDDEKTNDTNINLNAQLQNYVIYDKNPLHYSIKNLIEIGTQKNSDEDFRLQADDFDLKNTLIYYFIKDFGIYGRFDVNSHFFTEKHYESDDFYCTTIDKDGVTILDSSLVNQVKVKSPIFPLTLKEGVGINYRILNYSKANLSLRMGFGLRQEINNDYFLEEIKNTTPDSLLYIRYQEKKSEYKRGTEVSLVGSFQLPLNLSYSLNADFLFPFGDEENYSMEWENVINVKILKYISLDYKLKLTHQIPEIVGMDDYIALNHTLYLRLTYFLR